jgi:predicted permease
MAHISIFILKAAGGLVLVEVLLAFIAVIVGKYFLKLTESSLAVFVLCSTFSSTGLLGNSFLKLMYEGNSDALAEGIIIGQLAITAPNYLLTPAILSRFHPENSQGTFISQVRSAFITLPNLAIITGLAWALLGINISIIAQPIFTAMKLMGDTIPFLVAISIGLSLNNLPNKNDVATIAVCALLILLAEPVLIFYIDTQIHETYLDRQLSFILAAMPAAPVIAVYAIRYEANPKLASSLVTATTVLSAITIPSLLYLFKSLSV